MTSKKELGVEPSRATPAGGLAGTRKEVGNSATSQRHPPHVSDNADEAPIQEELPSPTPVPTLGANASGQDEVSTTEQAQPIDEESMYDRRPAEDKARPPSSPKVP